MIWPRTRVLPLHAIWKDIRIVHPCLTKTVCLLYRAIRVKVVPAISWVYDNRVGVDDTGAEKRNHYRPSRYGLLKFHGVRRPIKRYSEKTCVENSRPTFSSVSGEQLVFLGFARVNGVAKGVMFAVR